MNSIGRYPTTVRNADCNCIVTINEDIESHMARIDENYLKLAVGYLFPEIARRVSEFCAEHPGADVIRLGIGDVSEPLPKAIVLFNGQC